MMDGHITGLEAFGLGSLEGISLFEEEKKEEKKKAPAAQAAPEMEEKDFLFERGIDCPLCESSFKAKAVRSSKIRPLPADMDLRPRSQGIDTLKYDVISCPICGYTALLKYFPTPVAIQRQRIREKICANYRSRPDDKETYTYEDAADRYKLALVNAVVKGAKASEKAYICLKSAWIQRGKAEEIGEDDPEYVKTKELEMDFLKNAFEGFIQAVATETYPMCGMDEMTVTYLLSVLGLYTNHFDVSARMVATILTSRTANARMKDKALLVKEELLKKKKAMENNQ